MALRTLAFFLREVLANFKKNPFMVFASIATVMFLVAISGSFLLAFINMKALKKELVSQLEIIVYLKSGLTENEVSSLNARLINDSEIAEVRFVSKSQALDKLKEDMKQDDLDLSGITGNPLPDSFIVRAHNAPLIPAIAQRIGSFSEVRGVNYWEKNLDKFFAVVNIARIIGLVIVTLLGVATIFIINNTIRLSVFARRREIKIMELVGAAHWFIRGPFILEGMFYGLVGSLAAIFCLRTGYNSILEKIQSQITFLPLVTSGDILMQLFVSLLFTGVVIGGIGSYVSVSKFLKL